MNYKYRNTKSKARRRLALGGWFLLLLFALVFIGHCKREEKPITIVVEQKETVFIPCEKGVPEYLECLSVKGEITSREAEVLTAISKAESGYRPDAKNRKSTASGSFQIIAGTWYAYDCVGDKWNFKDNTQCAIKIYRRSGTTPWNASKSVWSKLLNN